MKALLFKAIKQLFPVLLLFSLSSITFAQISNNQHCANPSNSLLWKIGGQDSTVYLFGSLHLGKASFYPLAQEVETAFKSSNYLVFEVDPSAAMNPEFALQMQQEGMLPNNETLNQHLSPEVFAKLQTTLEELGLPAPALMRFKTWFLTLMLSAQQMLALGYEPNYGVESYFLREKPETTTILELESLQSQLNFLTSLDGEAYLEYTLNNMDEGQELMEQMAQAWACAEKPVLTKLLVDSFEMEGINEEELEELKRIFLTDRNQYMANKIEDYIVNGEGNYFVVVGAAHYLGEDSIVDFLRDKNYTVNSVEIKKQ